MVGGKKRRNRTGLDCKFRSDLKKELQCRFTLENQQIVAREQYVHQRDGVVCTGADGGGFPGNSFIVPHFQDQECLFELSIMGTANPWDQWERWKARRSNLNLPF